MKPARSRKFALLPLAAIATLVSLCIAPGHAQDHSSDEPRLSVFNEKALVAWWQTHPDANDWQKAGTDFLAVALRHAERRYGVERSFENDHFRNWLVHCRWLSLFPDSPDAHPYFSSSEARDTFRQLSLRDGQALPALFVSSLDPADDAPVALENLCRIAEAEPEAVHRYRQLAVALSVVFDQPFPDNWPHPFVKKSDLPLAAATNGDGSGDVVERFRYCLESIAAGRFVLDPAKLSVRDLTFAIDSPLAVDELRYARQVELKRGPASLTELYTAIRYDLPRANRGDFVWPHGNYSLFEIGKRGGICADQAHFVAHTGKALGIPTLLFFGQGRSGGHAWVGYLEKPGRWELNVARFEGENYPVGVAWDPQSWRRLTDAQFRLLTKDLSANQRYEMMQLILQWAELSRQVDPGSEDDSDRTRYRALLHHARSFMPRYLSTWELESEYLIATRAGSEKLISFWHQWVANFREETDLRIRGQVELLGLYRNAGDERSAERLEKEIQLENKSERFDLAITVAAGTIMQAIERGDWAAADTDFESALKRFRSNSGGHLFYNLVRPYIERCLEAGKSSEAGKALEQVEKTFEAASNSLLDQDMKALRAVVSAVAR